jgi:excinuclease ABC subunit C
MWPQRIQELLPTLPDKPGVYQHLDKNGKILYIGKAKNLRKRVSSYFAKNHDSARIAMLVRKVADIRVIVTDTEMDALLLENTLIKTHQPRYNINLKDDKTYPWIVIKAERFPRIFYTRQKVKDGSEYYGPYASVKVMKALLELIRQIYPLRTCNLALTPASIAAGKFKVCLEYHLGNCLGPCEGLQEEQAYLADIDAARNLIKGRLSATLKALRQLMLERSAELRFEEAQKIKEKIDLLERYQVRSTVVPPYITDIDVFSAFIDADSGYVNYLQIVEGAIVQSYTMEFKRKLDETEAELLGWAIPEIRSMYQSESKEVIVSHAIGFEWPDVQVSVPQRGDKKSLVDLSLKNGRYFRLERLKNIELTDPDRHVTRLMQQMKADLRLSEEPRHIECFDNSNIQGTHPVSACVVFKDGKPSKADYRHFNVKTVEGPDDFATMAEVVHRRYARLLDEGAPLPQLIVVDGGKGQLSAAVESLEALGLRGKVAILGIAKRLEELYFPGDPLPLYLDKRSETLKVIQRMRDEAHRFGITHHRQKRSKAGLGSTLEDIPGIGKATREALLRSFKSVKKIREANETALAEVVGASKARLIVAYFAGQTETK